MIIGGLAIIGIPIWIFFDAVGAFGTGNPKGAPERIENIVRIFMHQPGDYSLMIKNPGSAEIETRRCPNVSVKIIQDLEPQQSIWALVQKRIGTTSSMELHIHKPEDINGAGWDNGKQGKGTTTVIE